MRLGLTGTPGLSPSGGGDTGTLPFNSGLLEFDWLNVRLSYFEFHYLLSRNHALVIHWSFASGYFDLFLLLNCKLDRLAVRPGLGRAYGRAIPSSLYYSYLCRTL